MVLNRLNAGQSFDLGESGCAGDEWPTALDPTGGSTTVFADVRCGVSAPSRPDRR